MNVSQRSLNKNNKKNIFEGFTFEMPSVDLQKEKTETLANVSLNKIQKRYNRISKTYLRNSTQEASETVDLQKKRNETLVYVSLTKQKKNNFRRYLPSKFRSGDVRVAANL
jgi:hypothetical protein